MLKTKIMMNEAIIISNFTVEEIKKVAKHKPDTLKLFDENGDVEFKYDYTGTHSVSYYGIEFGDATVEHKAAVRVPVCGDTEVDKKKYFVENYGSALMKANDIEERISEVLTIIDADLSTVEEAVEVCL